MSEIEQCNQLAYLMEKIRSQSADIGLNTKLKNDAEEELVAMTVILNTVRCEIENMLEDRTEALEVILRIRKLLETSPCPCTDECSD